MFGSRRVGRRGTIESLHDGRGGPKGGEGVEVGKVLMMGVMGVMGVMGDGLVLVFGSEDGG